MAPYLFASRAERYTLKMLADWKQTHLFKTCYDSSQFVVVQRRYGQIMEQILPALKRNYLCNSVTEGDIVMYDDDTRLFYIGNSADKVADCKNNKLTIHAGKSEAMIMSVWLTQTPQVRRQDPELYY